MTVAERSNKCLVCNAGPGERCTQPSWTGRREVAWEHSSRVADRIQGAAESPVPEDQVDVISVIDKTLDNIEGLDADWTSPEVVELLQDLRDRIVRGYVAPQEPSEWEHRVIGGEDLLARLMDTLAYYHCRSVNPKADSPRFGYHAMSEDQREFLRERQREAAEEVLRMWQSEDRHAPSPDREKLIADPRVLCPFCLLPKERAHPGSACPMAAPRSYREELLAAIGRGMLPGWGGPGEPIAKSYLDRLNRAVDEVAALAAPVAVDEAKLAEAKHSVDSIHQIHGESCLCGFSSARSRSRTEHITQALAELLGGGER